MLCFCIKAFVNSKIKKKVIFLSLFFSSAGTGGGSTGLQNMGGGGGSGLSSMNGFGSTNAAGMDALSQAYSGIQQYAGLSGLISQGNGLFYDLFLMPTSLWVVVLRRCGVL